MEILSSLLYSLLQWSSAVYCYGTFLKVYFLKTYQELSIFCWNTGYNLYQRKILSKRRVNLFKFKKKKIAPGCRKRFLHFAGVHMQEDTSVEQIYL